MSFTLLGVFSAGVLTFLSPCVLPLAPIFTANLMASGSMSRWARLLSTFWFALGFTLAFVSMGMAMTAVFSVSGPVKPILLGIGSLVFVLFGLKMMGVLSFGKYFHWMSRSLHLPAFLKKLPLGLHGLVFGLVFGLSWTPCVGPVLGGVLTYVASREQDPAQGALWLLVFSLGISLPLFVVAIASEYMSPLLNRLKRHLPKIEYAVGLGLFVFGIYVFNQARLQSSPGGLADQEGQIVQAWTDSGQVIDLQENDKDFSKMVFFYSENCPVCHSMQKFLPQFTQSCTSEYFQFYRVNVDKPENYFAANRFNVRAVPTISVLSGSGQEVLHLVGYQTEGRLREAANMITQVSCREQESLPVDPGGEENETCDVGRAC